MSNSNFKGLKIYLLLLFIVPFIFQIRAQTNSSAAEDVAVVVKTTGRLLTVNKLVMIIHVEVPNSWQLNVKDGYQSMLASDQDTVSLALKFKSNKRFQIAERLKADRKPSAKGYYYKNIVFAQTLRIDTTTLPIYIDAKIRLSFDNLEGNNRIFLQKTPCCLLKVCRKRTERKTFKIGWNCNRRENVYLEDVQ